MAPRLIIIALLMPLAACSHGDASRGAAPTAANTGLRYLRGEDDPRFAKASEPHRMTFPADHADHPQFRTEWWYFTGNVESDDGKPYGFELTFFRVALRAPGADIARHSAWATDQIWMAHMAVTDATKQRFVARERIAREALDLAGASTKPLRIWVKGWSAERADESNRELWKLNARDGDVGLSLHLATSDAPVLNGDEGLDRKGPEPGNASYYYSLPRLAVTGTIQVEDREVQIHGSAWMDREWSTSALGEDVAGWDWFGLRLSDGGSLMFYRLRRRDGTADRFSGGTRVDAAGRRTHLGRDDVELTPLAWWTSPTRAARYPVAWRLRVPSAQLAVELRPYVPDQELNLSVSYWEGAVRGSGTGPRGKAVTAEGYLELTGY